MDKYPFLALGNFISSIIFKFMPVHEDLARIQAKPDKQRL